MYEKFLGEFEVNVNVDWGKPLEFWDGERYVEKQALNFPEGFLARLLISESRVFLITEFTPEFAMGILTPTMSGVEKKQRSLYMELAVEKLEKVSFGLTKNLILFKAHGQLGRTVIEFKNLPEKAKKEIAEGLEKARALKRSAPDAGVLSSGRPVKEIYEERLRIIESQGITAPMEQVSSPEPSEPSTLTKLVESISKIKIVPPKISFSKTKATSSPPQQPTSPPQEGEKKECTIIGEGIELLYSKGDEVEPEEEEKRVAIWKSLVPKETICPYCTRRILTIDRKCPHCGAVNL
ncbi:MAG: hypothetical protein KIH08_09740 [Candidatus Freyarchaeota archaeon]|nr:hypothetical protein [Candidatus Jordarchaeia archaeon]MBS7268692.1 hypothetical protein [Candidatus Jordarchaeia archaeon]MBS7279758.1 hypothetical protein [Candidatus Jordarchaeia archaeon]